MTRPIVKLAAEKAWREAFARFGAEVAPAWLESARLAAFARFEESGLPTPRTENWRWSDIHRHLNDAFEPLTVADAAAARASIVEAALAAQPFAKLAGTRLVFIDGRLDAARSRIEAEEGVEILSLAETPAAPEWAGFGLTPGGDAVDLLALAYVTDGALIRVRAGVKAKAPIVVVNIATQPGRSMALRHVVRLEAGAEATLYEAQAGAGHNVSLLVSAVKLDKGARLTRIQAEMKETDAIAFANLQADVGEGAVLRDLSLITGGRFHRQQDFVALTGAHAEAEVNAAYLLRGHQHADTHLVVDHRVPHGTSRETFKCVMDDHARGAFQGLIHVAPGAQKTDGQMAAHGLLLGEMAEFDAKPELEIYADDVACAHGATAGALDEEQLFYLRARGIPAHRARAMLIAAFVAETFDAVEDDEARAALQKVASDWLANEERVA